MKKPTVQALTHMVTKFVTADDLESTRQVLDDHPALLSDEALAILDSHIAHFESEGDRDMVIQLKAHQRLLKLSREVGPDEAFKQAQDASQQLASFDVIVNNTLAVMIGQPDKRKDWFGVLQKIRAGRNSSQMNTLLDSVMKLLLGDSLDSLQPDLTGPHAACWARIVEGIRNPPEA
jgi:hypothetical protein